MVDLRNVEWNLVSKTSGGMLPKSLYKDKFYKLSNYNQVDGFYTNEPIYEELAYKIGELYELNVVKTNTELAKVMYNNKEYEAYVAISDRYDTKNQYLPIEKYCIINKIKPLELLKNDKYKEDLMKIIQFDFLINNIDRHGRNIEINDSEIAPIFDNSLSFFSKVGDNILVDKLIFEVFNSNNYIGSSNLKNNLDFTDKIYISKIDDKILDKVIENWLNKFNINKTRENFIKKLLKERYKMLENKFRGGLSWQ